MSIPSVAESPPLVQSARVDWMMNAEQFVADVMPGLQYRPRRKSRRNPAPQKGCPGFWVWRSRPIESAAVFSRVRIWLDQHAVVPERLQPFCVRNGHVAELMGALRCICYVEKGLS